jgi:hypothetical protein
LYLYINYLTVTAKGKKQTYFAYKGVAFRRRFFNINIEIKSFICFLCCFFEFRILFNCFFYLILGRTIPILVRDFAQLRQLLVRGNEQRVALRPQVVQLGLVQPEASARNRSTAARTDGQSRTRAKIGADKKPQSLGSISRLFQTFA